MEGGLLRVLIRDKRVIGIIGIIRVIRFIRVLRIIRASWGTDRSLKASPGTTRSGLTHWRRRHAQCPAEFLRPVASESLILSLLL